MTRLTYLYGFVPPGSPVPPPELTGIDGGAVRLLDVGPFGAATSQVDESTFASGALERRLGDLAWVGARGAEHERVVTWLSDRATIVPVRLFTLFTSETALVDEARRRRERVSASLERFRHAREWDLKVSYEMSTLVAHLGELSPDAALAEAEIEAAAPGRRYLLERKREEQTRREAPATARRLAQELLDTLRPLADVVSELELPPHRDGLPVVLDAALLVQDHRTEELRRTVSEVVARLEPIGIRAALTGPWAPYRFVSDDGDD